MQINENEHIFYRKFSPKFIAIRVTDTYIEIHKSHNSKPVQIHFKNILNIKFMNLRNIQFVIQTKNNKKFSMDAFVIDDIKSLINLLNNKHKTITDYNLRYDKYTGAVSYSNFSMIFTISLFLILTIFMIWAMSTKDYHVSKYYDKNLTIRSIHRSGLICPSNYQTINKTDIENKYIYRFECGFFYKTKLLYEKNITKDEIENIYLNDGAGMFTSDELFKYWKGKI